jgi:hypothetical protein
MTTVLPSEPEAKVEATDATSKPASGFQRALKRAEAGVLIVTVASLISSALYFLVATKGLDLVVWFEKVQPVYPTADTDNLGLPLTFQNESAPAVTLIKVNVSNLGDAAIGTQQSLWQLTISEPKASRLELVGSPTTSSDRIGLAEMSQSTRHAYSVQVGVLEPRARVEFWLMAVHDRGVRVSPDVSTSLAGLPRPQKTADSLAERLGQKLLPFMIPLSTIGFVLIAFYDLRDRSGRLALARDTQKQLREQQRRQSEGEPATESQRVTDAHLAQVGKIVERLEASDWRRSPGAKTRALLANGIGIVIGGVIVGGISANVLGWVMSWFV